MRITRLYLRNYRVYEDPVELEVPPGLVGIYGPNGAGKSALLESVLWTLWGVARTTKDEVRTAGVGADCITEVELEHEGHLYMIRRTLTGANATVRAQANADGAQITEGVRDTARYVHSVLGMDDVAFRASVFAEQKQLAAFSTRRPAERRQLVLSLLGITPLDAARDQARKDARQAHEGLERLRSVLADPDQLRAELKVDQDAAAGLTLAEEAAAGAAREAAAALAGAEAVRVRLDGLARQWEALVAEGRGRRDEAVQVTERQGRLEEEGRLLDEAEGRLDGLAARAALRERSEADLALVAALMDARSLVRRARSAVPPEPEPVDQRVATAATAAEAAQVARGAVAELDGRRSAAVAHRDRAADVMSRSAALSGEADCPLCGQPLGAAFASVRAHREAEAEVAREALARLEAERLEAVPRASSAERQAREAQVALEGARQARSAYERAVEQLEGTQDRLTAVVATGGQAAGREAGDEAGWPPPEGQELA
ncbi:MAG: AAA family ATPase, partial [Acidimicrobiales bacterium]